MESLFNKVADFIKNRLQHRYFPVNIANVLTTVFFKYTIGDCFCNSGSIRLTPY